jgi:hypothetical protein
MSKGSMSRVRDTVTYKNNYDSIFGKKNPALKEAFSIELLDEPIQDAKPSMIDKHMDLVEKFRMAGGSAEHHHLKQLVRESAWNLFLRVDCK